ncbi:MAG: ribose-5-phosphate isomerase RpiA [Nitrososphaerota archaeon]
MEKERNKERARMAVVDAAIKTVASLGSNITIGLGTGSTSALFINMLSRTIGTESVRAVIPTSYQSEEEAAKAGFKIAYLREVKRPDIYVDSFDQCDLQGNVIKGGGGAVTREKLLMALSRKVLLIGDDQKLVNKLNMAVPIEVIPFAIHGVITMISEMGWKPIIRQAAGKAGPVITDNGNLILDVDIGVIENPSEAELKLRVIPGVVEVGICTRRGYQILIGMSDGTVKSI